MQGAIVEQYKKHQEQLKIEYKRLGEELEALHNNASTAEERREGSPFGKREEEATETLELEKRLALENRVRKEMASVEHALSKIEKGTYGLCESCGEPINPERLEARPQSVLCLNCKASLAKNGKVAPRQR